MKIRNFVWVIAGLILMAVFVVATTTISDTTITTSGNVTSENLYTSQYLFAHTNETKLVDDANEWTNMTFFQEETDLAQGVEHSGFSDNNHTFNFNVSGIYDIDYDLDMIDTSAGASDVDVAGRVIFTNGSEVLGSVFETTITKQNVEVEVSHNFLARFEKGDSIIIQFIAQDAEVEVSTHGTFGEHEESASVLILKVANL